MLLRPLREEVTHSTYATASAAGTVEELPADETGADHDRSTHRYGTDDASEGVTR